MGKTKTALTETLRIFEHKDAEIVRLRKLLGELAREYKGLCEAAGGVANASLVYQRAVEAAGGE